MTPIDEEIAKEQADVTRLLLHHIHAPLTGTAYVRGVLPAPEPADAVRIVVGPNTAHPLGELIAYEIPLQAGDDAVTAYDIIGMLRTLRTGTHVFPSDRISTVMGMTLIHVDPITADRAPEMPEDHTLRLLRSLAHPFRGEHPRPLLRGFLFLDQDRLRLYFGPDGIPGVIAADVRPSGPITALIAALPSLVGEEERMTEDATDPHCSRLMDLTDW